MKKCFCAILLFLTINVYLQAQEVSLAPEYISGADALSTSEPEPSGLNLGLYQLIDSTAFPLIYATINDWIKTPYKYGGNTKDGIDCSGFVKKFYSDAFSVKMSGGSSNIFTQVEKKEVDELALGDLVFFITHKKGISHIGVYLGNNKFVHASTRMGVIISDLDEPYYKRTFYSGGRFKPLIDNSLESQ